MFVCKTTTSASFGSSELKLLPIHQDDAILHIKLTEYPFEFDLRDAYRCSAFQSDTTPCRMSGEKDGTSQTHCAGVYVKPLASLSHRCHGAAAALSVSVGLTRLPGAQLATIGPSSETPRQPSKVVPARASTIVWSVPPPFAAHGMSPRPRSARRASTGASDSPPSSVILPLRARAAWHRLDLVLIQLLINLDAEAAVLRLDVKYSPAPAAVPPSSSVAGLALGPVVTAAAALPTRLALIGIRNASEAAAAPLARVDHVIFALHLHSHHRVGEPRPRQLCLSLVCLAVPEVVNACMRACVRVRVRVRTILLSPKCPRTTKAISGSPAERCLIAFEDAGDDRAMLPPSSLTSTCNAVAWPSVADEHENVLFLHIRGPQISPKTSNFNKI